MEMILSPTFNMLGYTAYVISSTAFIILGIFLMSLRVMEKEMDTCYKSPRACIAWTSIVIGVLQMCNATLIAKGIDYDVLTSFAYPLTYYIQLYLLTTSILTMTIADQKKVDLKNMTCLPIVALTLIYLVYFIVNRETEFNIGSYELFTNTLPAKIIKYILLVAIFSIYFIYSAMIYYEIRRFRDSVEKDEELSKRIRTKPMIKNAKMTITYVTILGCVIFFEAITGKHLSNNANIVFVLLHTAVFVSNGGIIVNISLRYMKETGYLEAKRNAENTKLKAISIKDIENILLNNEANKDITTNETTYSHARRTNKEDKKNEPEAIEATVRSWMRLPSKPYCREGLALREAAAEMGIDQRLLSGFINSMYRMNFNAWINMLRIDEVKRLISQRPEMTLVDIAAHTGFTDSSAMSKIFKKAEGITPSQYKQQHKRRRRR